MTRNFFQIAGDIAVKEMTKRHPNLTQQDEADIRQFFDGVYAYILAKLMPSDEREDYLNVAVEDDKQLSPLIIEAYEYYEKIITRAIRIMEQSPEA